MLRLTCPSVSSHHSRISFHLFLGGQPAARVAVSCSSLMAVLRLSRGISMKRGLVRAARARASGKSFSAKVVLPPRTSGTGTPRHALCR